METTGHPPLEDARVVRTRRALESALLELAEERDFSEITASEIARRAGVNRNTLYLHYHDKDDLLVQTLEHLLEDLTESARTFVAAVTPTSPFETPPHWIDFMRMVERRRPLFRRILSDTGSSALAARLRDFHIEYFVLAWRQKQLVESPGSPSLEFRANFSANSSIGMLRWWLEQEDEIPGEVVAAWLWKYLHTLWYWDVDHVSDLKPPQSQI